METISYACHTAYLDPMTGSGLLVRPNPDDDVATPTEPGKIYATLSIHEADWDAVMRDLGHRGGEPSRDDKDDLILNGHTSDGDEVIALYGEDSIIDEPTIEQTRESFVELHRLAGVVDGLV
ncbi:hypothetical protein OWR29_39105 [Actinoplanes sp. Pm04-4]|uniref:Uncharacterized protein n=1 Tax=Paractinoplanes pyxinae TaxID=2997416 RepID=A0ABT4BDZ1_9ACTN|nr:hypothetical protein [Actinoplanes pyxinae]MCY1144040.1 hypothetical protein [Actinoplanes pyxinae]